MVKHTHREPYPTMETGSLVNKKSKGSCSPRKTGLRVNKTESDDPKMVNARPEILKTPQNLFILAEGRSARVRLYDVIGEVEQLLRIMRN